MNAALPQRQIVPVGDGFRVDIAGDAEALDRMIGGKAVAAVPAGDGEAETRDEE